MSRDTESIQRKREIRKSSEKLCRISGYASSGTWLIQRVKTASCEKVTLRDRLDEWFSLAYQNVHTIIFVSKKDRLL